MIQNNITQLQIQEAVCDLMLRKRRLIKIMLKKKSSYYMILFIQNGTNGKIQDKKYISDCQKPEEGSGKWMWTIPWNKIAMVA